MSHRYIASISLSSFVCALGTHLPLLCPGAIMITDASRRSKMVNHRQIEAFRAVIESGSMSAAARTLGISQPNISRFIAQLEASTGLKLFDRGAGKISPTEDAITFYHEVERSF